MHKLAYSIATVLRSAVPIPQWLLYNGSHVLAGAVLVQGDNGAEAQLLLDGTLLYGSRHSTRIVAEQELLALRHQCARDGWIDAV